MSKKQCLMLIFFIFAGCSQNVDFVTISPRNPEKTNSIFIGDAEHQGGNSQAAQSASAILSEQYVGGNTTRTNSSSPSFKMTSGIGVN